MAHSREVRLPFCDHRIIEFVATLPVEMLMGSAQTKCTQAGHERYIARTIVTRWHKQGFVPPITGWLRGDLRGLVETIFNDSSFNKTSIWDPVWYRRAWRRFRAGEAELAPTIWKILISECWEDRFLRKSQPWIKFHRPCKLRVYVVTLGFATTSNSLIQLPPKPV